MSSGGTNTTTSSNAPPQQFLDAYSNVVGQAGTAASTPYAPYPGQTVAGLSPDQQSGIAETQGAQGIAAPYINSAANYLDAATSPIWSNVQQFSPGAVQQYESPYTTDVVNATQNQFNNQNAIQQQGVIGNAVQSGAWGGDRSAVAQGIVAGQQQLAQAPVIAGLENQGYSQALNEFNTQQGSQLGATEAQGWLNSQAASGMGNLGQEALGTTLTGANALLGTGALEQTQAQAGLNVPYQQYLAAQAYPFQTTGWLANISEGLGGASGGTSSTTSPGPSVASQVGGGIVAGTGVLGQTGAFGNSGWLTGSGGGGGSGLGTTSGAISSAANDTWAARGGEIPHRAIGGGITPNLDVSVVPGAVGIGDAPATHGAMDILKNYGQTSTTTGGGDSEIGSLLKDAGIIAAGIYGGPAGGLAASALSSQVHFADGGGILPFPVHRSRAPGEGIVSNDNWHPEPRRLAAGGVPQLSGGSGIVTLAPSSHGGSSVPQIGTAPTSSGAGIAPQNLSDYFTTQNAGRSFAPPPVFTPPKPAATAQLPTITDPSIADNSSYGYGPWIDNASQLGGGGGGMKSGGTVHRDDGGEIPDFDNDLPNPITSPESFGIPAHGGPSVPDGGVADDEPMGGRGIARAAPMGDSAEHGNALDADTIGRAHEVYRGLTERGMDPATAIGFAANAVQESRANPNTNPGDMGASHGLLQWRGDRLARYVQMFGHAPEKGDLNEQLDYIIHEATGPEAGAWKAIQSAPRDPASQAAAVSQYFERPKDTAAEIQRRASIAERLATHFAQGAARGGGIVSRAEGGDLDDDEAMDSGDSDTVSLPGPGIVNAGNGSTLPIPPIPPAMPPPVTGQGIVPRASQSDTADRSETQTVSPWRTLTNVGLGIMGGTSPQAGVNIGKGALTGLALTDKEQQTMQQDALRRDQAKTNAMWRAGQAELNKARMEHLPVQESQAQQGLNQRQQALDQGEKLRTDALVPPDVRAAQWYQNATPEQKSAYRASQFEKKGLTDIFGNPTAASAQSPDASAVLHGDDYLKTLNPTFVPQVKMLAEGRMAMPTRPNQQQQQIIQAASQYDPTFDATDFNKRNRAATDFSPAGQSGKAITAINTTMGHLSDLQDRMNALGNGPVPLVNSVMNFISKNTGAAEPGNAQTVRDAVSNELRKVFATTGGGGLEELKEWENNFPINASPAQAKQGIQAAVHLMDSRLGSLANQWSVGMGTNHQSIDLLSSTARAAYQKLMGTEPTAENVRQPTFNGGARPQQPAAPTWRYNAVGGGGATLHSNDGQAWFTPDGKPYAP